MIMRMKIKDAIKKIDDIENMCGTWIYMRQRGHTYRNISKISDPLLSEVDIRNGIKYHDQLKKSMKNFKVVA